MLENSFTSLSTIAQILAESFADDPSFELVFPLFATSPSTSDMDLQNIAPPKLPTLTL